MSVFHGPPKKVWWFSLSHKQGVPSKTTEFLYSPQLLPLRSPPRPALPRLRKPLPSARWGPCRRCPWRTAPRSASCSAEPRNEPKRKPKRSCAVRSKHEGPAKTGALGFIWRISQRLLAFSGWIAGSRRLPLVEPALHEIHKDLHLRKVMSHTCRGPWSKNSQVRHGHGTFMSEIAQRSMFNPHMIACQAGFRYLQTWTRGSRGYTRSPLTPGGLEVWFPLFFRLSAWPGDVSGD